MPLKIYEPNKADTQVQYGSSASNVMRDIMSSSDKLMQRLQGAQDATIRAAEPIVTEETQKRALSDIERGEINSENVAQVARDVYKRTAEATLLANIEIDGGNIANGIMEQQEKANRYDASQITKAWDGYSSGVLTTIKDPMLRKSVEKTLVSRGQKYISQISSLQIKQEQEKQKNTLTNKLNLDADEIRNAYGVSPEATMELSSKIDESLRLLVENNFMTEEAATVKRREIYKNAYFDDQIRQFKSEMHKGNAEKFLEEFDKSNHGGIVDEIEKIKYKNILESEYSDYLKKNRIDDSIAREQSSIEVKEATRILESGYIPKNLNSARNSLSLVTPTQQRAFEVAEKVQGYIARNKHLTLPEQEATLNALKSGSEKDIVGVEVIASLEKYVNDKKARVKDDAYGQAIIDGVIKPSGVIGFNNISGIKDRVVGATVAGKAYGTQPQLFSDAEVTSVINSFEDATISAEQKVSFFRELNKAIPDHADLAYKQLFKKDAGEFAMIGEFIRNKNDKAAILAFKGQNADVKLETNFKQSLQSKLEGVFASSLPNMVGLGQENYNQVLKSLINVAKGSALTGKQLDADDVLEMTVGEPININKQKVLTPRGVTAREFEGWLDKQVVPNRPELTKGIQDMTDWVRKGQHQLLWAGEGKYYIINQNNGNPFIETKEDGSNEPFILEYKAK